MPSSVDKLKRLWNNLRITSISARLVFALPVLFPEGMQLAEYSIDLNEEQWKHVARDDDFTLYWDHTQLKKSAEKIANALGSDQHLSSSSKVDDPRWRFEENVKFSLGGIPKDLKDVRANITRCSAGKFFTGTFRGSGAKHLLGPSAKPIWPDNLTSTYLISNFAYADAIYRLLGAKDRLESGGVVILAGRTKGGKSEIAKALVLRVMQELVSEQQVDARWPHLVTFEDPMEALKIGEQKLTFPMDAAKFGFCYSPRQRGIDAFSLIDALKDAKRQTPHCFYVGEVRDKDDWKAILEFGGSGHLVITTTHAASIRECFSTLFAASGGTTPEHRRICGGRVLGIVHIRPDRVTKLAEEKKDQPIFLPSAWTQQFGALNSLVSLGLASIVPNEIFCFSREQFIRRVTINESVDIRVASKARELDVQELRQQ